MAADLAVELQEAARRAGVSPLLEQAPGSTGSGPECPEISETFGTIGFTIVTLIMMTSFSSVLGIRSFILSVTVITRTGTILTPIRPTVTPADMAMDTETPVTDPGMKPQVPRL